MVGIKPYQINMSKNRTVQFLNNDCWWLNVTFNVVKSKMVVKVVYTSLQSYKINRPDLFQRIDIKTRTYSKLQPYVAKKYFNF